MPDTQGKVRCASTCYLLWLVFLCLAHRYAPLLSQKPDSCRIELIACATDCCLCQLTRIHLMHHGLFAQPIECLAAIAWEAKKPLDVTTVIVGPPQKGEVRVRVSGKFREYLGRWCTLAQCLFEKRSVHLMQLVERR